MNMLKSKSQNNICDLEAKFVQDRITKVETHFADLCNSFAAYTRKAARLRDKNDELSKVIKAYAESEVVNRSLGRGLLNFATTLSVIGDYRDAEVQRLDTKIIAPLSQYSIICKHARENVKSTFIARDKEITRRRNLDKLREKNPQNRQMISQAESELMKATMEVSRVVKGLEEQIDSFERRKLRDLKTILLDFITIGLSFHTKAVEHLTKAYQDVAEIDEIKDLEAFREFLNVPDTLARLDTVRRTSCRQAYSLSNLTNRLSSSPLHFKKATQKADSLVYDSSKYDSSNSLEFVQVEEYAGNSDESEPDDSESTEDNKVRSKLKSL